MTGQPLVRALLASAAILAAVALGGCDTESTSPNAKSIKPIPEKTLAEMSTKQMSKESPLLVRIFKEESELEVWKQDVSGRYALLKSFPICRWSGDLGPKVRQGDRQAPEGFYNITPAQMNPNSNYYLAFNLGFPNTYDKANDRTGDFLMIHGDCSSAGCYAMTDEQIGEIFALARESFFGGQRSFQIQAYPFHMTPANFAKHRNNPNMPFWRMLKEGSDQFEVTHLEPKVDVCDKRYVFNANAPEGSSPLNFSPRAQCPVFHVPDDVMAAATKKKRADDIAIAELTNRGMKTAPVKMATDGGMHPVFLAALGLNTPKTADDVRAASFSTPVKPPGTIPSHVNPPVAVASAEPDTSSESNDVSVPRTAPRRPASAAPAQNSPAQNSSVQVASAGSSGGFLGGFSRMVGLGDDQPAKPPAAIGTPAPKATATPARPAAIAAAKPSVKPVAKKPVIASAAPAAGSLGLRTQTASAGPVSIPAKKLSQPAASKTAAVKPGSKPTSKPGSSTAVPYTYSSLTGAAPVLSTGGFR